ncbi:MAG: YlqD family protein [Armatimonadota bacterium]|nr:YlqD family protein [Armatimonadota bacterium]
MGVTIKRAVRIKMIVTEDFKRRRCAELEQALAKLDETSKRVEFEIESVKRRSELGQSEAERLTERLRQVQRRNERARAALVRELELARSLEIGSEYDRGVVEGLVEVNVGDDFAKIASCEIVVKDDRIVEIREGQCPESDARS